MCGGPCQHEATMNPTSSVSLAPGETVRVVVLSRPQGPINGKVVELSGNRLRLLVEVPVVPNDLVKVEGKECLLLGETLWCEVASGGEGQGWVVGVEVEHAVWDIAHRAPFGRQQ